MGGGASDVSTRHDSSSSLLVTSESRFTYFNSILHDSYDESQINSILHDSYDESQFNGILHDCCGVISWHWQSEDGSTSRPFRDGKPRRFKSILLDSYDKSQFNSILHDSYDESQFNS